MSVRALVVIPCGGRKQPRRAPAATLYTGPYFRGCLAYARSVVAEDNIFVLSAKYGLLALDDAIEPYDLTLGQPGCVLASTVYAQARARDLLNAQVYALGGRRYTALCRQVWPTCIAPLTSYSGLGYQLAALKHQRGRLFPRSTP